MAIQVGQRLGPLECLLIEKLSHGSPGSRLASKEMKKVPAWQRGWELVKSSPNFPKWLETMRQFGARKLGSCPFSSIEFAPMNGRDPCAGDILRYTDLKPLGITSEDVNDGGRSGSDVCRNTPFPSDMKAVSYLCGLPPTCMKKAAAHPEDLNLYGMRFLSSAGPGSRTKLSVPVAVGAMYSDVGRREPKSASSSLRFRLSCFAKIEP